MYCPECGIEYRAGFNECTDCRVPLVAEKLPDETGTRDPDLEFVIVLEGNDPLLIAAAKDLLDGAGIPFYVLGDEFGVRFGPVGALIHPWCRVQVAADREQEARRLLQELEEAQNPKPLCNQNKWIWTPASRTGAGPLIRPREAPASLKWALAVPVPRITPVRLARLREPFDHCDWTYEVKHDGFREFLNQV